MQFCAPAFIARIAVSSPRVSDTIRNGTSMSRSFRSESASTASSDATEISESTTSQDSAERGFERGARIDALEHRLEAATTQLLEEEPGVGRRVVHHESPYGNAH